MVFEQQIITNSHQIEIVIGEENVHVITYKFLDGAINEEIFYDDRQLESYLTTLGA